MATTAYIRNQPQDMLPQQENEQHSPIWKNIDALALGLIDGFTFGNGKGLIQKAPEDIRGSEYSDEYLDSLSKDKPYLYYPAMLAGGIGSLRTGGATLGLLGRGARVLGFSPKQGLVNTGSGYYGRFSNELSRIGNYLKDKLVAKPLEASKAVKKANIVSRNRAIRDIAFEEANKTKIAGSGAKTFESLQTRKNLFESYKNALKHKDKTAFGGDQTKLDELLKGVDEIQQRLAPKLAERYELGGLIPRHPIISFGLGSVGANALFEDDDMTQTTQMLKQIRENNLNTNESDDIYDPNVFEKGKVTHDTNGVYITDDNKYVKYNPKTKRMEYINFSLF